MVTIRKKFNLIKSNIEASVSILLVKNGNVSLRGEVVDTTRLWNNLHNVSLS